MRVGAALAAALVAGIAAAPAAAAQPSGDESAVRALAGEFVATQEREDAAAYLALWSPRAPGFDQARRIAAFVFRDVDYRFTHLAIDPVHLDGDRAMVRVIADREIVDSREKAPGSGEPIVHTYRGLLASVLTCAKEDGVWRVWEESSAIDPLANALAAAGAAERDRLLAAEPRLVSVDLRRALASRADRLYVQQAMDAALDLLLVTERVALAVNDREGLASAYHNIGNVYYHRREYAEALDRYRRRLAIEAELGNADGQADAWLAIATTEYSRGDYATALDGYERALALRETLPNQAAIADLLVGIGNVRFLLGDYAPALDAYVRARAIYERSFSPVLIRMRGVPSLGRTQLMRVLQGIGRVRIAQGDFAAAADAYDRALEIATAAEDVPGRANSLVGLAEVRHLQGRAEAAVDLYGQARDLAKAQGDLDGLAHAASGIGLAELTRGRPGAAADAYRHAHAAYEQRQNKAGMGLALTGLGYAQAALDAFADSVATYDTAIGLLAAAGSQEAAGRALVGKALALEGLAEPARALEAADRAAAIAAAMAQPDLAWRAAVRIGEAQRGLARPEAARAAFTSAIAMIEAMRRDVGADLPPAFLNDRAEPYLAMAELSIDQGDVSAALTFAERARAQIRWDLLARSPVVIDRGMSAADRDTERVLVREIISLRTQLAKARELAQPDESRRAALETEATAAADRYAAFAERLTSATPQLVRWRGQAPPLDATAAIAAAADDRLLVLEYLVTDDRVHIFAIGGGRLTHRESPIGRKALAAAVSRALDPTALASREAWRAASSDLSTALLAPVRDALPGKAAVVVMPDGVLWRVPWEALEVPGASAEPPAGPASPPHALIEDAVVTYASSITTWQDARQASMPASGEATFLQWLAFGAADAADEVQAIRDVYGPERSTVHLGADAHEPFARAEIELPVRAQFAGAGALEFANPLYSRVRLGSAPPVPPPAGLGPPPADRPHEVDDVMDAWEVMGLESSATMVVCSALEWPSGTLLGGDGVFALSWAWLVAGTPSVAINRWAVPPTARTALLTAFHRSLAGSTTTAPAAPPRALREAILQVMRTPGFEAPVHWAGFMMVGRSD